jgi:hypothetical protein
MAREDGALCNHTLSHTKENRKMYTDTTYEQQSQHNRVKFAEGLIKQLPADHDGRNTWMMNYGVSAEAVAMRDARGLVWDDATEAAGNALTRMHLA